jgi:hypothetical protein
MSDSGSNGAPAPAGANAALCFPGTSVPSFPFTAMISPETFNHIENIKKRAGHLWRFL